MTYRGVYRDGVVRVEGDVDLRNGSHVEITAAIKPLVAKANSQSPRPKSASKVTGNMWELAMSKRLTKAQRIAAALAACGDWKDRTEWKGKSSSQIASELRKTAASRVHNG